MTTSFFGYLGEFIDAVHVAYNNLPVCTINDVFVTLMAQMNEILRHGGGNNFPLPHTKKTTWEEDGCKRAHHQSKHPVLHSNKSKSSYLCIWQRQCWQWRQDRWQIEQRRKQQHWQQWRRQCDQPGCFLWNCYLKNPKNIETAPLHSECCC